MSSLTRALLITPATLGILVAATARRSVAQDIGDSPILTQMFNTVDSRNLFARVFRAGDLNASDYSRRLTESAVRMLDSGASVPTVRSRIHAALRQWLEESEENDRRYWSAMRWKGYGRMGLLLGVAGAAGGYYYWDRYGDVTKEEYDEKKARYGENAVWIGAGIGLAGLLTYAIAGSLARGLKDSTPRLSDLLPLLESEMLLLDGNTRILLSYRWTVPNH